MHFFHKPALVREVIASLGCKAGGVYVDGTVGGAGHAFEILKESAPDGLLIGIDADEDALHEAEERLSPFRGRVTLTRGNFADIGDILVSLDIRHVDGILLDLGVSSHQLDAAERGFSFSKEALLDMRMDFRQQMNAYTLVNTLPESSLAKIIREYGEENMARRIARTIVAVRKSKHIETTTELANIILSVIPKRLHGHRLHPATKTFQALRIAVNNELSSLQNAIDEGIDLLRTGGRFSIISYHSLEDRIVKTSFRSYENACICPHDIPVCNCQKQAKTRVIYRRPVTPSDAEISDNPRARSAKLRTAERI